MKITAFRNVIFSLVALLAVSNAQKIYSPNYPEHYFNNIDCNYTIRPTNRLRSTLNLILHEFQTETRHDYLEIYEGINRSPVRNYLLTTQWSGRYSGLSFQLKSPVVMRFRTDDSDVDKGFDFSYGPTNATSDLSFTCDRKCSSNSIDRQCGSNSLPRLTPQRCYNPCNRSYYIHLGVSCPKYFRFISSTTIRINSFEIRNYQCYSFCQKRNYYLRSSNCNNDNANLCLNSEYDYLPECHQRSSTPSPKQYLQCYNPCNESYILHHGVHCPEYFRFVQSFKSYVTGDTTFECFSLCQNRYYTTNGAQHNCSNSNANLFDNLNHPVREEYRKQWQQRESFKPYKIITGVLAVIVMVCAITIAILHRKSHVKRCQGHSRIKFNCQPQNSVHLFAQLDATCPPPPPYETCTEGANSSDLKSSNSSAVDFTIP